MLIVAGLIGVITFAIVYTPNQQFGLISDKQCELTASLSCAFHWGDQQVIVKFAENAQVEELNIVSVTLPENAQLVSAWVQGVNMFMGKTPLYKIQTDTALPSREQRYEFFIGSCSEEQMKWQLILTINGTEHSSKRLFVNFTTHNVH
jgi:hypothetical protein